MAKLKGKYIEDSTIDEVKLNISNAPTNEQVLTADSAETGGWKWANVPTGFADPTTTRGDIIFKNSSATTTRLAAGTANQVLQSDGTDIGWQTLTASDLSDFDAEVANNASVTANTAKVTNADHTGEVTGDTVLTIADGVIDEANMNISNAPTNDQVLTADNGVAGGWKWAPLPSDGHDVQVSANDTTPGYLNGKLVITSGKTTLTELNDGGNETLRLGVGTDIFDKTVDDSDDVTEGSTNLFLTTAERTKLGFTTVTQAVDLDTIETDTGLNNTHRTSDGTDHGFINQDVQSSATPTFVNLISSNSATNNNHVVRLDQMNSAISGLEWQKSVLDQVNFVTTEPAAPTTGDRYINTATGNSSVTSQAVVVNRIYEWNGTDWTEYTPTEGWTVWDKDADTNYTFNGTSWVEFGSTVSHNNTTGLQGGQASEYYHMTAAQNTIMGNTSGTNTGDEVVATGAEVDTGTDDVKMVTPKAMEDSSYIKDDSVDTLTNKTFDANGTGNSISNIDVADLANGTDGELITWDASGAPATVAVGTANQILTSNGAGTAPTFQDAPAGSVKIVEIVTLDATDIANHYNDDLTQVPLNATSVQVTPVGGVQQEYTVDFTVITDGSDVKRINWNGLGLDSILESGDKLIVSYTY